MKVGYKELIERAEANIESISIDQAEALLGDEDTVFVDIRDIRELQREGKLPGATHAPRGMLEFWVDPESPYFKDIFGQDKRFVLHCASGWRSALAAKTLADMGLDNVAHIGGGFTAWKEAGGEVPKEGLRAA